MLAAVIGGLLEQLVLAAVDQALMVPVTNDGPPARFVAFDPETGVAHGAFVESGATVRVNHKFRLLVERVDCTRIRPLCDVKRDWRTA